MVSTIDPAEIAEHRRVGEVCATCLRAYKDGDVDVCRWPCLPYRLAEALAASEAKVARVREVRNTYCMASMEGERALGAALVDQ